MKTVSLSYQKPEFPSDYFYKQLEDGLHLITHPTRPAWIAVNNFGLECIKLFDGSKTIDDVAGILMQQYAVDYPTVSRDLHDFLRQVEKAGMLTTALKTRDIYRPQCFDSAFLNITDKCNLSCRHCYATECTDDGRGLSDRELLGFLETFYAAGGREVIFSGGEPFLKKNIGDFFRVNPQAKQRILTNGTLITDSIAAMLERYDTYIQISIDGSRADIHDAIRGQGAFAAALKGVRTLQAHGLAHRLNFCTTIMKYNIRDLANMLPFARAQRIGHVRFIPLRRRGTAVDNWRALKGGVTAADYRAFYNYIFYDAPAAYPDMRIDGGLSGFILKQRDLLEGNHGCGIGKTLYVNIVGDVYPCSLLVSERYKMGNIRSSSIDQLRNSPVLEELLAAIQERKNRIKKCTTCMWKQFCGGACIGESFERFGTVWKTDQFCDVRKRLYENSIRKLVDGVREHYRQLGDRECF